MSDDRPPMDGLFVGPPQNPGSTSADSGAPRETSSGHDTDPSRTRNFVVRNWRGEFPLWIAYWGFGFLGTIAVWIAVRFLADVFTEMTVYHPLGLLGWLTGSWALATVVTVWQLVGIWRSAGRSIARCRQSGKSAAWALAARVMVAIGVIRFLGHLVTAAAPQLNEGVRIAFLNDPDTPDYALRLMNEETEIEITGGIKYGLDRDLQRILEAAPKVRVVHLDSGGGRLGEAEKLYRTIRDRGLATYVTNDCLSACGNVFVGGHERWISGSGRLGFHRSAFPGDNDHLFDEGIAFNENQVRETGISSEFIRLASRIPNKDMWYPQTKELLRYKVITGIVDDWQFALSGIGGVYTREEFERLLQQRYPILVPFSALETHEYGRLLDEFHLGYLTGRSAGALVRAYEQRIFPKAFTYLEIASDTVLRDYLTLVTDQYRYLLGNHDPNVCADFISGNKSIARSRLPRELVAREVEILEQALFTPSARSLVLNETLQPDWDKVAEKAYERIGNDGYDLIWEPVAPAGREQAYCNAIIVYFEEILNLPTDRAAELVRFMVRK